MALLVLNSGCSSQNFPEPPKEVVEVVGPEISLLYESLNRSLSLYGVDNVTLALAEGIVEIGPIPSCEESTEISPEYVEEIRQRLYQYGNFAEGVRRSFDIELPYLKQESLREIGKITGLCTLGDSYNKLVDSAYLVLITSDFEDKDIKREYYEEFYLNLSYFALNVLLIQSGIPYKVAFGSVGLISNAMKFKYLTLLGGPIVPKVTMSVAHWEIRGKIWALVDALRDPDLIFQTLSTGKITPELHEMLENADMETIKELGKYLKIYQGNINTAINQIKNSERAEKYKKKLVNVSGEIKDFLK